jgi:hypothetical protein
MRKFVREGRELIAKTRMLEAMLKHIDDIPDEIHEHSRTKLAPVFEEQRKKALVWEKIDFNQEVQRRKAQRKPSYKSDPYNNGRAVRIGWNASKKDRPRCGAATRAGGTCQAPVVPGTHRCRMHAGRPHLPDPE